MYKDIIAHIGGEISALNTQISDLTKQRKDKETALEAIRKLQAEEDRKAGNLAVQRGGCPFPQECNERGMCTKTACSADVCSNGYAYRMS